MCSKCMHMYALLILHRTYILYQAEIEPIEIPLDVALTLSPKNVLYFFYTIYTILSRQYNQSIIIIIPMTKSFHFRCIFFQLGLLWIIK